MSNIYDSFNEGYRLLRLKQYQEAINYFDIVIKQNPKEAKAYINKGLCLENQGKYEEAI